MDIQEQLKLLTNSIVKKFTAKKNNTFWIICLWKS